MLVISLGVFLGDLEQSLLDELFLHLERLDNLEDIILSSRGLGLLPRIIINDLKIRYVYYKHHSTSVPTRPLCVLATAGFPAWL